MLVHEKSSSYLLLFINVVEFNTCIYTCINFASLASTSQNNTSFFMITIEVRPIVSMLVLKDSIQLLWDLRELLNHTEMLSVIARGTNN